MDGPRRRRRGLSLVEAMVALVLLSLLVGIVVMILRFQKLGWFAIEKLDSLQRLRMAQTRLSGELELGTSVLHPPEGSAEARQLVFATATNRPQILYVDTAGKLKLKAPGEEPRILCSGTRELRVRHSVRNRVECFVRIEGDDGHPLDLSVGAFLGNHFWVGEGAP